MGDNAEISDVFHVIKEVFARQENGPRPVDKRSAKKNGNIINPVGIKQLFRPDVTVSQKKTNVNKVLNLAAGYPGHSGSVVAKMQGRRHDNGRTGSSGNRV
jgi:hypothetical protein